MLSHTRLVYKSLVNLVIVQEEVHGLGYACVLSRHGARLVCESPPLEDTTSAHRRKARQTISRQAF